MPHRDDLDDDLMDPSSDAYDYKPISSGEGGGSRIAKTLVALSVIAALAGGAWYFVGDGATSSDKVPVVRADTSPMKIKPSEPGGMEVPNRDKTVYDRVSGENTEPKLERLLPRPEQPLEKPKASMALPELSETINPETGMPAISKELAPLADDKSESEAALSEPTEEEVSETAETPEMPEVPSVEMAKEAVAPPPAPVVDENAPRALVKRAEQPSQPEQMDQDALAAKIAEALNEEVKETEVKTPEVKPSASIPAPEMPAVTPTAASVQTGYALQLLSSKSKPGVEKEWQKIKSKNGDLVNALPANIVKADLGDKGVYYRLRLGPVATGDQAKELCGKLKQRDVGCFIVRIR